MFGNVRKVEQLLREQLAEKERIVKLLVEQVQYLRAQQGMATTTVSRALAPADEPHLFDIPEMVEEIKAEPIEPDEADVERLQSMLQAKVISQVEFDEALRGLTERSDDDIIE